MTTASTNPNPTPDSQLIGATMSMSLSPTMTPRWERIQFGTCISVTVATLVYLLFPASDRADTTTAPQVISEAQAVRITELGHLEILPDSPLGRKLQIVTVAPTQIATPVLSVPGIVIASLKATTGRAKSWQFHSPGLLTTYTDWQKAIADIAFAKTQLDSIRQLADSRVAAQNALVTRLQKLVEAGTDTDRELTAAQAALLQAQIEGHKDTHEAETTWRLAQRAESALSHQLQQEGVDPDLLRTTTKDIDVVAADVPELLLSRVQVGQGCEARFPCIDGRVFSGTVRALSPVLSEERRSLRALFTLGDPEDLLRPGMYADIGLGTDTREAFLVPIDGVVHVGSLDYLLVQTKSGAWQVMPVAVGELHDTNVEVLSGIQNGGQVIGQGAMLLKPFIVEVARRPNPADKANP